MLINYFLNYKLMNIEEKEDNSLNIMQKAKKDLKEEEKLLKKKRLRYNVIINNNI